MPNGQLNLHGGNPIDHLMLCAFLSNLKLFNHLIFSTISARGFFGFVLPSKHLPGSQGLPCATSCRSRTQGEGCASGSSILGHGLGCGAQERLLQLGETTGDVTGW